MRRERLIDYLDRRMGSHAGRGAELLYYCPMCIDLIGSESDKRKLAVNVDKQKGQCFRCEFKFRSIERLFRNLNGGFVTPQERIIMEHEPPLVLTTIRQTVREVWATSQKGNRASLRKHRIPPMTKALKDVSPDCMPWKRAVSYLAGRGFSLDDAIEHDVHYCRGGRYKGYLIFPVRQGGEQVYWTSRYAGDGALVKSWNPNKEDGSYGREHCLLGYDEVLGEKVVTLVEGPLDRLAPPAALALMGKEMSPFQAELIEALVPHGLEELVIMLDPGTGAKIDSIYADLVDRVSCVRVSYLDDGDPAERKDEMAELLAARREPTLHDRVRSRFG